MAYEVTDQENESLAASLGSMISHGKGRGRILDITVRVGSPKLDNYHIVKGQRARFTPGAVLPIDDVPNALRRTIWIETDRSYRQAARRLIEIKSDSQMKIATEDQSDDFSAAKPAVSDQPVA